MQIISNQFTSYLLTPSEEREAAMLNTYQLAGLQNELAKVAAEKLALEFDPSEPARFQQSEAFLRGQQTMLTYLVARSEQYSTDQPLAQSEGQGGESTDWD